MHVYAIFNAANGKLYIGQHAGDNLEKYFAKNLTEALAHRGGKKRLYNAIRKHGAKCFSVRSLHRASDKTELNRVEVAYIKLFGTQDPDLGYNIAAGGGGTLGIKLSATTRSKMRSVRKGQPKSKEWAEKLSLAQRGRQLTAEHKSALSKGQTGKKKYRSPEHCRLISDNKKLWWAKKRTEQCQ